MTEAVGATVAAPPQAVPQDILSIFGLKGQDSMPVGVVGEIMELTQLLSGNGIDAETAAGIIKSFEAKAGQAEDPKLRVSKFLQFIRSCNTKDGLLNTVKSLGFFSKAELEEYGRETGDWAPMLKRIAREKK